MKKALGVLILAAALLLLTAPGLYAQQKTGTVSGFVMDDTGIGLPGAAITATSEVMPGVRTAVSDAKGYYRLRALIPGTYQIIAEMDGFKTVKQVNVAVSIGAIVKLDFSLEASTVKEEVVVTAEAPVIEPEKTSLDSVVTSEILNTLPILGRDFMSSLRILPGVVTADETMSISGGRDTQKNYNIDGMDNVDVAQGKAVSGGGYSLRTDSPLMSFDQEAIQELSISRGGYSASTGWGSGGLINVVTKSGSNNYHGSLYVDARNNKWDYDIPVGYESYYFGGSFSGPIIKDKLLFFLSFTPRTSQNAYDTRSSLYIGVPDDLRSKTKSIGGFAKLSWLINEQHTLNLSSNTYFYSRMRHMTLWRNPGDYPEENNDTSNVSLNLSLTSIFSQNFMMDSRILYADNTEQRRNPADVHAGTIFELGATGYLLSGCYGDHDWVKTKFNWTETGNIFVDDWLGRHTLTFGTEVRYNKEFDARVAIEEAFIMPGYASWTYYDAYERTTSQTYYAGFVSDKWAPVRNLILEFGLRVSNNSFMSEFLFEPRLNLSYDPIGDGKTVIRAGANLYRDRINNYVQQLTTYPLGTTITDLGFMQMTEESTYRIYNVDPDLTYPTTYELMIGVDRELFKDVFASASFIYRKYEDQLFSLYSNLLDPVTGLRDDPTTGRRITMTNGGYANYKGLQLVLGKRLGQGWYQFLLSFTHQVSYGNSFLFLDMSLHQAVFNPMYKGDLQPSDVYGRTGHDKPYVFKAFAAFKLPLDFMLSGIFNLSAGSPYTTYAYDYNTGEAWFVSEYQALRSPDFWTIDVRLEKTFRINKYNLRFRVDAFNLTNRENVYQIDPETTSSTFGMPFTLGSTRQIQLGVRFDW